MKEQVARILGNMAHEIKQRGYKDPAYGLAIKQATLEICQKFPKTVKNPDGYEPNLNETIEEKSAFSRHVNCQSRYKGVHWHTNRHKWQVDCGGKYFGLYSDEQEAAKMYNQKAKELYGEYASLNEV